MAQQVSTENPPTATASLFDLRLVLALLFGVYGLVLTIMGLLPQPADALAKAGGWNVNLWVGVAMLIACAVFVVWTRTRPLAVGPAESDD